MSDTGLLIALAITAVVAIAIFVFAWRATASASPLIKGLVRFVIPAVVFIAGAFAVLMPTMQHEKTAAAPDDLKRFEYRPNNSYAPRRREYRKRMGATRGEGGGGGGSPAESTPVDGQAREGADVVERSRHAETDRDAMSGSSAPRDGVSGTGSGNSAPMGEGAPPEPTSGADAAPEEEAVAEALEEAAPSGSSTEVTAAQPPAPKAAMADKEAKAENEDWDVVPVFYGTDRKRSDDATRLNYDGNRGRRLELGHALVSVPKSHQVPNIERPWALRVPYFNVTIYEEAEDPKKHFTMQELKALSRADFLKLVHERLANSKTFKDQAFVFVHGFNTTFENGVYRTAQIANDLKFDGAPFLYSWPSGGGVASYTYDRESSGQATPYLRDFMNLVINESGAKAVSVIAHSMGNQPILQVLKDLKNATPEGVVISQVILAAPDVDRDNFENIAKEILGLAKGITLYVAANDQALQYSRRFHGGVPRAGDVPAGGPVVINGIDTIDVTAASTDSLGINHSGYAENNALLKDIARLIQTGQGPANRHPPNFQRIEQGQGAYWKYPAQQ